MVTTPLLLMKTYSIRFNISFLALVLLCENGFGEVVFNNFGPNDGFDLSGGHSAGWNVFSPSSPLNGGIGSAARFQVDSLSYSLTSVSLAMNRLQGTNNLAISIVADNGGLPTGAVLETIVSHPTGITTSPQILTYPSSLDPVLIGGNSYWLVVQPTDLNLTDGNNNGAFNWWLGWNSPVGTAGFREFNFTTEDWYDWQVFPETLVPAFRIEGVAIPEPGTLTFALLGLGLIGWARWRGRQPR